MCTDKVGCNKSQIEWGIEVRIVILWQCWRPVITGCNIQRYILIVSHLYRTKYWIGSSAPTVFCYVVDIIGKVPVPLVLVGHIFYITTIYILVTVHKVGTRHVIKLEFFTEFIVSNQQKFCIWFKVILFLASQAVFFYFLHCIIFRTVGKIRFYNAGTIIVKCVFCREIQPICKVQFQVVETECAPAFILILTLFVHVIWIQVFSGGRSPVHMKFFGGWVLWQVRKAYVIGYKE